MSDEPGLPRNPRVGAGRKWGAVFLAIFAIVVDTGRSVAEAPVVGPALNAPYENADVRHWREVFEQEGREVYARRAAIVDALALKPGMSVADVGAGTGFYTLMFAETVGRDGRVFAVDTSPDFVAAIGERAKASGFGNVTPVLNDARDVRLPVDSIDLAFICDTYHHFEYPRSTMASLRRALRPAGEVVVIDFRRVAGRSSPWVMHHVRAGVDEVKAEIEGFGFELVEELNFLNTQYYLRFRKK